MPTINQFCRTHLPALFTTANPAYDFAIDTDATNSRHIVLRIFTTRTNELVTTAAINYTAKSWDVNMWPSHNKWLSTIRTNDGKYANADRIHYTAGGSVDTTSGTDNLEVTEAEFIRISKQWLRRVLNSEMIGTLHQNHIRAEFNRRMDYARYTRVAEALWSLGYSRTEPFGYIFRKPNTSNDVLRTTIYMRPANQPAWTREPQVSDLLPEPDTYMICEICVDHQPSDKKYTIELRSYSATETRIEQAQLPHQIYMNDRQLWHDMDSQMHVVMSVIIKANMGE